MLLTTLISFLAGMFVSFLIQVIVMLQFFKTWVQTDIDTVH